jgi:SAM-dependent methyltransferase
MSPSSTFLASDGDGYELNMGRWSRRLAVPFVSFTGLHGAARVLDVGCGTGHLGAALVAAGAAQQVEGVDLSPAYIEHARRHHGDARLQFRVGDACALDEPDGRYDAVLSLLVLHFVPRADAAIAQMCRVARPGAVVAAAGWDARGGWTANRLFWDTAALLDPAAGERRGRNYTRPLTRPGELAAAWQAAGLRGVAQTTLVVRMDYASFDDYWAPCVGNDGPVADYVRTLDDAARSRVHDAVRNAYLDGEADGPRSYAALAWAVKGTTPT